MAMLCLISRTDHQSAFCSIIDNIDFTDGEVQEYVLQIIGDVTLTLRHSISVLLELRVATSD